MLKIMFFKNVWEYFSRVGGIKIRGLGILPDQKNKKNENMFFDFSIKNAIQKNAKNVFEKTHPLLGKND